MKKIEPIKLVQIVHSRFDWLYLSREYETTLIKRSTDSLASSGCAVDSYLFSCT